jgi:hypothetical protein
MVSCRDINAKYSLPVSTYYLLGTDQHLLGEGWSKIGKGCQTLFFCFGGHREGSVFVLVDTGRVVCLFWWTRGGGVVCLFWWTRGG